ncbi:lipoprotein [Streptomyces justiciae]|uniref:lipoprotein n=1 Tax=Streptomyces justiciae TaxID=2780140 RepID=UPI0021191DC1|nr:lipoprotein [Streptomyces justiciae]MCW8376277.1 lipoprotein [Streptomyces justiciae]
MLVGVGKAWRRTVHAAVLVGVLAGCSGAEEKDAESSASPSVSASEKVESGGTVGAPDSACLLPVGFDLAAEWKADAIDGSAADGSGKAGVDEDMASLLRQGPVSLVCEVDAKPAGHLGFLRVYTGEAGEKDGDARAVLEAFVAAQDGAEKAKYSTFEGDGVSGAEVEYLATSELLDEAKQESAFAVVTPDGPVVIHLGGADSEEHQDMLPAFELAKKTLHTV